MRISDIQPLTSKRLVFVGVQLYYASLNWDDFMNLHGEWESNGPNSEYWKPYSDRVMSVSEANKITRRTGDGFTFAHHKVYGWEGGTDANR